jgi:hypothetical protein
MLQTPHGERNAVGPTVQTVQQSYADKPTMPVIDGEAAYEMLNDSLPTKWTRQMFWLCMTNGAAGHTYGANGIWQCNRPGQPHGPSPYHNGGVGYGRIPWNEAMNLPGSRQVGLGKKLFERFEWQKFTPHPEWAAYAKEDESQPKWGHWIWFPEGDPAHDAPAAKRYFRKSVELPNSDHVSRGTLWLSADDRFTAYLNGEKIADHAGTGTFISVDVTSKLKPGKNVLAIEAENMAAAVPANPAGLLATFRIRTQDGREHLTFTDNSWKSTDSVGENRQWTAANFDDSNWKSARDIGPYGCPPWGQFSDGMSYGPYATGIPGETRIIYVPESRQVRIQKLEPSVKYQASVFDPTTGETTEVDRVASENDGESCVIAKPQMHPDTDDWVIVMSRLK